jgi:membrane protease YdiL (CAAX protease family)
VSPRDQFPPIVTPELTLEFARPLDAILNLTVVKALIPVPVLLLIAPFVWLLFRGTWQELDAEARAYAQSQTGPNYRPAVALVLLALTLTIQDYYGGRAFFNEVIDPLLSAYEARGHGWVRLTKYRELYSYGWWVMARVLGYALAPLIVWKILFRHDSILDMGLRVKGFFSHLWIYALCLVVVFFAMGLLAQQRDFLSYYPFYKQASRSWFDLAAWEAMYFVQFFALEFYFRGFLLGTLRKTMGSTAIFAIVVPYCMIHFGKPYLEANGAIIAGIVLGSLAMRTKSVYAGFLVHITVAGLMDFYALVARNGLPTRLWPN